MNRQQYVRFICMTGMMLGLLVSWACAEQNKKAPEKKAEKKEYVFKGKVEAIDAAAKTFTVNGEKVEGWMDKMTMSYVPDKEDVLKRVKVGDQITAKVYDGDFRTLHDVQVVPVKTDEKAAPAAASKKDAKAPAKK